MIKAAFVTEIGLGHTTFFKNLQEAVAATQDIEAAWLPIVFDGKDFLSRIPKLRHDIVMRAGVMAYQQLSAALRGGPYDVLFFHTQMPSVFCHRFMRDIPTVISLDATPKQFLSFGQAYGFVPNAAQEKRRDRWYRRAFNSCHHLITWSSWAKESLMVDYNVPASKITPISPGVNLELFRPNDALKPNDGVVRLLFVGGDFERKGGDLLLRWARETSVQTPWEVHLVTRDPVPSVPGVVVHHGVTGNSTELANLYQKSDIFVLPTRADCYSLVAMEAMACGLPVVISRLGGIPEIVKDEETGFLIDKDDYSTFVKRLDHLVVNASLRNQLSRAALARARTCYSGSQAIRQELDILRSFTRKPDSAGAS